MNIAQNMKIPPYNIDAEIAVLGAMFLNADVIPKIQVLIEPLDFYRSSNEHICRAFFNMEGVNILGVVDHLERIKKIEEVGGVDYLYEIAEAVSTSSGYEYWCKIIKDLANKRKVIIECQGTTEKAHELHRESEEIISDHNQAMRSILSSGNHHELFRNSAEIINDVIRDVEARAELKDLYVGIKTGFESIDQCIFGLEPKTTTYLIARPSMGKTCLALNIAENVAAQYSKKVLFFSLESGDIQLTRRRLAAKSGVFLSRIRTGDVEEYQWSDLIKAAGELSDNNLIIADRTEYKTVERLVSVCQAISTDYPLSLIVVDHIQRMRSKKRFNNRHLEISYISEELSSLANDLDIPVLILCQLSRELEKRPVNKQQPRLSDMKECVTGGTEVYTNKGPRAIKNLYKMKDKTCNFLIKSFNKITRLTEWKKPSIILHTGKKDCLRIRTKSGKVIVVGKETSFFNGIEWVKAKDLKLGGEILTDPNIKATRKGVQYNTGKTHFPKTNPPWNKGLTKESDPRVYVASNKQKGKRFGTIKPIDYSEKRRVINPPLGRKRNNRGYIMIYEPEWPSASHLNSWRGYVFEHRYVMEKHLGRSLDSKEVIHHLDGDKEHNHLVNLFLCKDAKEHEEIHKKEQRFTEKMIKYGFIYYDGKDFKIR